MLVDVYRNLNRGGYSIRCVATKKVIAYASEVYLKRCSFIVQQGGRKRVLKTGHKNVHAFIRGELAQYLQVMPHNSAYYNPRKNEHFSNFVTGERIDHAALVHCTDIYKVHYV